MKMKINLNFLSNLGFLRKYSAMILPVVFLLISVIIIMLVLLTGRSLKADIDKNSVRIYRNISSKLSSVPSAEQHKVEQQYQDLYEKEVKTIQQVAINSSVRPLLSNKVFPKPVDTSRQIFFDYGKSFMDGLENLVRQVNGRDVPTELEIQKEVGVPVNRSMSAASRTQDSSNEAIIDAFCTRRAEEASVYVNPRHFAWYTYWENYEFNGDEEAIRDCWYSQIAFWIYQDVFDSIGKLNSGSSSILTSKIKRLIGISFQTLTNYPSKGRRGMLNYSGYEEMEMMMSSSRNRGRQKQGFTDNPKYVTRENYSVFGISPLTGRICNEDYDVVHFSTSLIINSRDVAEFMKELSSEKTHKVTKSGKTIEAKHNQITILKSELISIDREAKEHQYYRYGAQPVMQLNLICEYILNRKGYGDYKPLIIKELLGEVEPDDASGSTGTPQNRSPGQYMR